MPRRNKPIKLPIKPVTAGPLAHKTAKRAYASKHQAQQAAQNVMRYDIDTIITTYQSPIDGKWYLTSQKEH